MRRLLATIVATSLPFSALAAGDPSQAGAYCPFPKKGEKPACFAEVESEYPDFLAAVGSGVLHGDSVDDLERALQDEGGETDRSLALSSLAYGYFMLAERAAAADSPDPALVARLERWNELLGNVYEEADEQPGFRTAVRDAARDLHARAPAVSCEDGGPCPDTGLLLQTLRGIDETGVRGPLENLLRRIVDDEPKTE